MSQAISECMGKFTAALLKVKKLREERENRRLTFLEDVESKRIQLDERRIAMEERRTDLEDVRAAVDTERAKELVGALTWSKPEEVGAIADSFNRKSSLPNVAGAIDGIHIRIWTPTAKENPN
ncbi:hypothetical protein R1flu_004097 [Riccia fluitans]|uniref:Uncharacterized protein n=1 Tax=Riccia fluitans TaxID=41844 RepID=A0ABD1YPX1_9MARC